jgi:two-component system C4-dicarboxylate transport sensor histidine kinase DctB
MQHRTRRRLLLFSSLTGLLLLISWLAWQASWRGGMQSLQQESRQQLQQFIGHLDSQLARYQFLPRLIARNQLLVDTLRDPGNSSRIDLANRFLEDINHITGASDTYLMDAGGTTLAASNWNAERPFVGRNFSFRPYFQQAMRGQLGRYYALGSTSRQRGYYFAWPIIHAAEPIGALVVKMDLAGIEQRYSGHDAQFIVTDPDSVVFISTRPAWLFHSLRQLDPQALSRLANTRRYPERRIRPLPVEWLPRPPDGGRLLRLPDGAGQREYLLLQQPMPEAGWQVAILTPLDPVRRTSLVTTGLALLTALITLLLLLLLRQRYRRRLERQRYAEKAQRELEHQVALQTTDLRREIEERKRTEQRLRDTQGELIQTAKLAVLGQMSASISHELNNPLAAIRGYADNARKFLERGQSEPVDRNLQRIGELTERMGKISSQLKQFARKSSDRLEAVRIEPVIQTAIDLVMPQYRQASIRILNRCERPGPRALAEMIPLEQVLINLINNAVQAVDEQGEIAIACERQQEWVLIHVDDSGPGLDQQALEHIFDPFYTTKKTGLGLGLSISARIMDSMNGHLSASNRPEGGARFTISLMAADDD